MHRAMLRFTPVDVVRNRYNRLFEDALGSLFTPPAQTEEVSNRNWIPAVDVAETPESLSLYAELPGLSKEDVEISLEDHTLTIRGERKFEKDVKEENYHRIERSYGTFSRSFTLPANVRNEDVQATFKDGVLTIQVPKVEEAKPRKIAIA